MEGQLWQFVEALYNDASCCNKQTQKWFKHISSYCPAHIKSQSDIPDHQALQAVIQASRLLCLLTPPSLSLTYKVLVSSSQQKGKES